MNLELFPFIVPRDKCIICTQDIPSTENNDIKLPLTSSGEVVSPRVLLKLFEKDEIGHHHHQLQDETSLTSQQCPSCSNRTKEVANIYNQLDLLNATLEELKASVEQDIRSSFCVPELVMSRRRAAKLQAETYFRFRICKGLSLVRLEENEQSKVVQESVDVPEEDISDLNLLYPENSGQQRENNLEEAIIGKVDDFFSRTLFNSDGNGDGLEEEARTKKENRDDDDGWAPNFGDDAAADLEPESPHSDNLESDPTWEEVESAFKSTPTFLSNFSGTASSKQPRRLRRSTSVSAANNPAVALATHWNLKDLSIQVKRLPESISNMAGPINVNSLEEFEEEQQPRAETSSDPVAEDRPSSTNSSSGNKSGVIYHCLFKKCLTKKTYTTIEKRDQHMDHCSALSLISRDNLRDELKIYCELLNCPRKHCFKTQEELEQHIVEAHQSHQTLKLQCEACEAQFTDRTKLQVHFRVVHEGKKRFVCDTCGYDTERKGDFLDHARTHTQEKTFQCPLCPRKFLTAKLAASHKKRVHEGDNNATGVKKSRVDPSTTEYLCKLCGYKCKRKRVYQEHILIHTQVKTVPCPQCPKIFLTPKLMQTHKRRVHDKRKDHQCAQCGKLFYSTNGLSVHVLTVHEKSDNVCSVCGKIYSSLIYLHLHMGSAHHLTKTGEPLPPGKRVGKQRDVCDHCGKTYVCRFALNNHIKMQHEDTPRSLVCQVCGKAFVLPRHLRKHIKETHKLSVTRGSLVPTTTTVESLVVESEPAAGSVGSAVPESQ